MLYIVGRALDSEYSLRSLAKSTKEAAYFKKMKRRVRRAKGHLMKIVELTSIPEIDNILEIVNSQRLEFNNETALTEAAEEISKLTQKFAVNNDGKKLEAVDPLIPPPEKYKGGTIH